jgi:peptidoglycan glycosyltransferase
MNRELKRVSLIVTAMFLALFISSTNLQVLSANSLADDPRNVRAIYDGYQTKRGALLVDSQPIAESTAAADAFHYNRKYSSNIYSSITGFYSYYQGATGLESSANDYLSGKNSAQFFEQLNSLFSGNPVSGASIELTIDPKIQKVAYEAMGNKTGAVVAIEPSTGNILAMVSTPGFDANKLSVHSGAKAQNNYRQLLGSAGDPLINKAIGGSLYTPGSVFKLVVAAAALESGQYTVTSELPNPRSYTLPGTSTKIHNSGNSNCGGTATVSLLNALRLSCNIPFAELGVALGQETIRNMAKAFGFGKSMRIPTVATASTYPENMDDAQTALSAFGQFDVRVTPLQMAMITAAIANGGKEMNPNLIENVQSSNLALLSQTTPSEFGTPISKSTADGLKQMMIAAVASGVSTNGAVKGTVVAGKTGTAQNGNNAPYTLWFAGFAPAENPQVAVVVMVADGGGLGQGGSGNLLAAPVARKVIKAVLNR